MNKLLVGSATVDNTGLDRKLSMYHANASTLSCHPTFYVFLIPNSTMRSTILILACMVAVVVSAPNTKGDNKQADEASPFAQLTLAQRTCVMDHVKAEPSILVSI